MKDKENILKAAGRKKIIYIQRNHNKGGKNIQWRKDSFFKKLY